MNLGVISRQRVEAEKLVNSAAGTIRMKIVNRVKDSILHMWETTNKFNLPTLLLSGYMPKRVAFSRILGGYTWEYYTRSRYNKSAELIG